MSSKGTRSYCFTINNYTDQTVTNLLAATGYVYIILGKEVAPSTNTKHLQSFIYFKDAKTSTACIKYFKKIADTFNPHIEETIGTNQQAIDYCKKDGDYHEAGTPPVDKHTNGSVNKWNNIIQDIKEGISLADLSEKYPEEHIKYVGGLMSAYNLHKPKHIEQLTQLRTWQTQLITTVNNHKHNDRTIHWIYDLIGNNGKTVLSHHLTSTANYIKLKNGKSADIAMSWNGEDVIFDLSRTSEDHINYDIIEQLKDGYVFSPKYNSCVKHYKKPKLLVFSNYLPKISAVSLDRWQIYTIEDHELVNITESIIDPPQPISSLDK